MESISKKVIMIMFTLMYNYLEIRTLVTLKWAFYINPGSRSSSTASAMFLFMAKHNNGFKEGLSYF